MTVGVLDNGTVIDEKFNAVFFTPYADVKDQREVDFYTIHWWGNTTDFMTMVRTFTSGNKQTSAHFGVEAGHVACLVNPDDVAWACGNWEGNLRSISIECNPRGSDEDYLEIAALIRYLRNIYGDKPLVPHSHWVATQCPGTYDLDRIEKLSRIAPTKKENTVADVTTEFDRYTRAGLPDGSKTSVAKEAQWNKANKEEIKDYVKQQVDAAKKEILDAIKAK